jgi:hypothetical protein
MEEEAAIDLTSDAQLKGIVFPTAGAAKQAITFAAHTLGFGLDQSTSLHTAFFRFHCDQGRKKNVDRGPDGRYPRDGPCPFHLRFKVLPGLLSCQFTSGCFEHNHELHPNMYSHRVLDARTIGLIQGMVSAGSMPITIQKFLRKEGIALTTLQISMLGRPQDTSEFRSQSSALISHIKSRGGRVEYYQETLQGRAHVVAVFIQTRQEADDLSSFCEVVLIDGTHAQLSLKWEMIPIIAIDQGRHLRVGGICYAAYFDQNVVAWLLSCVWNTSLAVREKWRVVVTDQNSSFEPGLIIFKELCAIPSEFYHVYCAEHKTRNFVKKLNECGQAKSTREIVQRLFKLVCYSDQRSVCDSSLKEIQDFEITRLNHYIENHIIPVLDQFAKARVAPLCMSLGINTSSAAESGQRMLKRGLPSKSVD